MTERWLPVVGWEGWYEVSDQGRVRRSGDGRLLQGTITRFGYRRVYLTRGTDATGRYVYVHLLVAEAFLGPRPPSMTINHRDGVKLNNRPGNLEYVTQSENARHSARIGLNPRGERNGQAKLTAVEVIDIRRLLAEGMSYGKLAARYGVHWSTIRTIKKRGGWKHVGSAIVSTSCP